MPYPVSTGWLSQKRQAGERFRMICSLFRKSNTLNSVAHHGNLVNFLRGWNFSFFLFHSFLSLHYIYWKYIKYQLTGSPFKVLQSIIWKALFFSCFSFKSYWTLIECPDGTYGKYCLRRCNCPEAVRCDHVHGKCDVTCPAGLTGPNCQKGNERLLP